MFKLPKLNLLAAISVIISLLVSCTKSSSPSNSNQNGDNPSSSIDTPTSAIPDIKTDLKMSEEVTLKISEVENDLIKKDPSKVFSQEDVNTLDGQLALSESEKAALTLLIKK